MSERERGRPLEVLVPADIRFPLERANGVQIVKTAAALSGAGARTTLLVRQSDPRPTSDILALFGVDPHPCLRVRRLGVLHRRGTFVLPRASFLARATIIRRCRAISPTGRSRPKRRAWPATSLAESARWRPGIPSDRTACGVTGSLRYKAV